MKRLCSSDSLDDLMSICPISENESPIRKKHIIYGEYGEKMEEEEERRGRVAEKKRRLSVEQVKELEKNFEEENKMEPQTKLKLATKLGLQPRQVAVWFQNRRARCKTKQLETDYVLLKASFEALQLTYHSLQRCNQALLNQIQEVKTKVEEEKRERESNLSIEEETLLPILIEETDQFCLPQATESKTLNNYQSFNNGGSEEEQKTEASLFSKDGSSDSDSSAIFNEDHSSSSSLNYNYQFQKMEEHNFFTGEEACNFFSDEQAPTLQWWN